MSREPITSVFSRPRPVSLAGRTFLVGEVRLADVIDLQEFIERRSVSPLEASWDELGRLDGRARAATLYGILDRLEEYPPLYGKSDGFRVLDCAEGIFEMFRVILRWSHPELDVADENGRYPSIEALAGAVNDSPNGRAEYAEMKRVWRRATQAEEVSLMLGIGAVGVGDEIGWPKAIFEVIQATGWTFGYIEGLTLSQFKTVRTGGNPVDVGQQVAPRTNLKAVVKARRAARLAALGDNQQGVKDGGS